MIVNFIENWYLMNDLYTRFKPLNLEFSHLNNEELWNNTTHTSRTLFLNDIQRKNHSKITIWDATYIHIGTSANIRPQQRTCSFQKKRHLFKPVICVLPDGYIYDIFPLNPADATIMNRIKGTDHFAQHFVAGDTFVFDRRFRDIVVPCNEKVIRYTCQH